ncbi:MORN repeat-containing protein [Cohnella sp. AR92]|uniref:MORN repeat-containing protein n=1 Tax=Cohnella sp. AR92 TaxID=648716 RepID=UPI000F8C4A00|nr:hypothetical protein [Cohnella sp. AR92]RUS45894.1 hypothetical protein ELR57_15680 [Cohnella sp. AR92]
MIEKIVKPYITPIVKKIVMPLKRLKNWPKLLAKFIKKLFKSILGQKEITKASYVRFGNLYVSKKLIVISILVLLVLYFFIFIRPPKFINKMLHRTPSITVSADGQAGAYSGDAKLKSKDGDVLFEGSLVDGQYDGQGKLYWENGNLKEQGTYAGGLITEGSRYNEEGQLIYTGAFADNVYEGQGRLYYPNGNVSYQGEFKAGTPNGTGSRYSESGVLLYEGGFANGVYNGEGTEYAEDGTMIYQGGFLAGNYDGTGKKLYDNGVVQYSGEFISGKLSGAGSEFYESGSVKYEGAFLAGLYSGSGTLYTTDGTTVYAGGFLNGSYQGEGELFGKTGLPVYKGSFSGGKYHGEGQSFDDQGRLQYQGSFVDGKLNGLGTWYKEDGSAIYKGYFRNGELDPSAFLGLSAVRLEELLGKATGVDVLNAPPVDLGSELSDDPVALEGSAEELPEAAAGISPSLKMRFQELKLSFIVEMDDSGSGEAAVQEVQIGSGAVLERMYKELSARAKAEGPALTLVAQSASASFYAEGLTYRFELDGKKNGLPLSGTIVRE